MSQADRAFTGSIPEIYETKLVPALFEPYADDLAERVAARAPLEVLELAAGTGALTRELVEQLSDEAQILATDLNQAMLDEAMRLLPNENVRFEVQDANKLPYEDDAFDAVTAQFGVMFFSDKVGAFREVRRVLREGGTFAFNVWNELQKNRIFEIINRTYKEATGQPSFFERVPFAYCNPQKIESELRAAGFSKIKINTVAKTTKVPSAKEFLEADINGSPFLADFQNLEPKVASEVRERIAQALISALGDGEATNEMSALVVEAQK